MPISFRYFNHTRLRQCAALTLALLANRTVALSATPRHSPAQEPTCGSVVATGADQQSAWAETPQVQYALSRVRGWNTNDLERGKWAGVVVRTDANTGVESSVFPGLKAGATGCVHFQKVDNTGSASPGQAYMVLVQDGSRIELPNSLICIHTEPNRDLPPHADLHANECREGSRVSARLGTQEGLSITLAFDRTAASIQEDLVTALRGALQFDSVRINKSQEAELMGLANGTGVWFPCSATGCCRVFA